MYVDVHVHKSNRINFAQGIKELARAGRQAGTQAGRQAGRQAGTIVVLELRVYRGASWVLTNCSTV